MVCSETKKMKKCPYNSVFVNYNENMSENIKSSDFAFDYTDRLYCSCHKITLSCGRSCIASPKWLENKQDTTSPKNFILCSDSWAKS